MNIKVTPELAEIAGIFAADGCLQKDYLCVYGNLYQEIEYYNKTIKPLFKKVFNIDINLKAKPSNSVYGFYLSNKEIVNYFNKILEFPIGKKTYTVKTPSIILKSNNKKVYSSFIRGFADCDGNLNFDRRRGNYPLFKKLNPCYPRLEIKCVSLKIIEEIKFMLSKLGINKTITTLKSKKSNEVDQYRITLQGTKCIDFMKKIGLNNSAQTTRFLIWKKYGFCPAHTTFEERRKILKGEISPYFQGTVAQPG